MFLRCFGENRGHSSRSNILFPRLYVLVDIKMCDRFFYTLGFKFYGLVNASEVFQFVNPHLDYKRTTFDVLRSLSLV